MLKRNPDEDGRSVSSNMKNLSLQQGKSALSNKRPAAEPAKGHPEEGGRRNKLRSASTDDSFGRGLSLHAPRAALFYEAVHDQRPPALSLVSPGRQTANLLLMSGLQPQQVR
jgi:hypothetical protein